MDTSIGGSGNEAAHPTRRADGTQADAPWFSPRSLRAKLQLFSLLLVVVPGTLIGVLTLDRARSALEQAGGRQLAEVAHDALEEVARVLADEGANVRGWARQDVMRDVRIGDLDKRVARFLGTVREAGYRAVLCADRSGRVVAATDPAEVGTLVADRPWFRAALAGSQTSTGPEPDDAEHATIDIAAPILDPDEGPEVIGVMLARYDWAHVIAAADRIRRTLLPHGLAVDVLLFDRSARLLGATWRDADEEVRGARIAAAAALARALPADSLPGWATSPTVRALLGYDRGDPAERGWLAVVMEPVGEAFGPMREMERRLLVALLAVLLGALAVATYLARRMSNPLRALTQATREIALAGAPRAVVSVTSHDEIGELARAFNVMATALHRAQEDLLAAAKFAFVGEVAAGVAHEVRTPLGILRSSAQMLERSVPKDRPEIVELSSMMVEEVDRLDRVVDGLLELARPHQPQIESTALEAVLTRAIDFADAQAREKRIGISCEFTPRPTVARCDPDQIYHVALNLIVNALQILPPGGHIVVRTLARHDGRVAFAVHDDGPGIPPDAQARIFTPFFSLRPGGTGLGLALVQRVVHEHRGAVTVESTVGRGTTFHVELPAAEDAT